MVLVDADDTLRIDIVFVPYGLYLGLALARMHLLRFTLRDYLARTIVRVRQMPLTSLRMLRASLHVQGVLTNQLGTIRGLRSRLR